MSLNLEFHRRTMRGPRIVKTSRGVVSFAAVIGAAILIAPGSVSAQTCPDPVDTIDPCHCPSSRLKKPLGRGALSGAGSILRRSWGGFR